jgi:hypothetical protein
MRLIGMKSAVGDGFPVPYRIVPSVPGPVKILIAQEVLRGIGPSLQKNLSCTGKFKVRGSIIHQTSFGPEPGGGTIRFTDFKSS